MLQHASRSAYPTVSTALPALCHSLRWSAAVLGLQTMLLGVSTDPRHSSSRQVLISLLLPADDFKMRTDRRTARGKHANKGGGATIGVTTDVG